MARKIESPTIVEAAGNKPKIIEEYIGNMNTQTSSVSIARMQSPGGWIEPGQTPEFDEYTVVLRGKLQVKTQIDTLIIEAGQAVITSAGEWVQYSTPRRRRRSRIHDNLYSWLHSRHRSSGSRGSLTPAYKLSPII